MEGGMGGLGRAGGFPRILGKDAKRLEPNRPESCNFFREKRTSFAKYRRRMGPVLGNCRFWGLNSSQRWSRCCVRKCVLHLWNFGFRFWDLSKFAPLCQQVWPDARQAQIKYLCLKNNLYYRVEWPLKMWLQMNQIPELGNVKIQSKIQTFARLILSLNPDFSSSCLLTHLDHVIWKKKTTLPGDIHGRHTSPNEV